MATVSLPKDANGQAMQLAPAKVALATTYDTSVDTSTEVTLNAATSYIEVVAISKPIFMKWGTADVTTSNFDHMIPVDKPQGFVVPAGITAVNFIEQASAATLAVTEF